MSKEQGKPKGIWSDLRPFVLFIVFSMVILAVFFFLSNTGWQESPQKPTAYNAVHDDIQNAVAGYAIDHDEALPILNGTYTNADCSNCSVINISDLLVENGGLLASTPDGLNLSTSGNDNCGGNARLGCVNGWHYIWLVDNDGDVFSYCAGIGCATNDSGYQDVYP